MFKKKQAKIFCVGRNKTGTSSLKMAMKDLGFKIGDQRTAEHFIWDYSKREFKALVKYCKSADFFQDVPFSYPYTFIALDQFFPNSKFILTVRDSPEEWYNSMVNFQIKVYGNDKLPSAEDLKKSTRVFEGFAYHTKKIVFDTPDDDLYNKKKLIENYELHNQMVRDYFRYKKQQFIEINIAKKEDYIRLCDFLDLEPLYNDFPWLNKTNNNV